MCQADCSRGNLIPQAARLAEFPTSIGLKSKAHGSSVSPALCAVPQSDWMAIFDFGYSKRGMKFVFGTKNASIICVIVDKTLKS